MDYMFYDSNFNQDISNWNTNNLESNYYMFKEVFPQNKIKK